MEALDRRVPCPRSNLPRRAVLRRARAWARSESGYSFRVYRLQVSLAQLVQALAIAGVGLAIAFVPLALVWAVDRGFGPDILISWRAAVDAWLLGHGVSLQVTLPEAISVALGTDEPVRPFDVTLWPLGFALLTFVLSYRAGLGLESAATGMAAEHVERVQALDGTPRPQRLFRGVLMWGILSSTVTTAILGVALAASALHETVAPSLLQAAFMPALVSLVGHVSAVIWRHRSTVMTFVLERLTIPADWSEPIRAGFRVGGIVLIALIGLGAGAVGLTIFTHFDRMVAISEASSPTVLGAIVMFLAHLAVLPNAVLWAVAWLMGIPVELGSGSTLSAFEVTLGPLPGIPLFGAVPAAVEPWFLALVILTAIVVIALGMMAVRKHYPSHDEWWQPLVAAASALVLVGGAVTVGAVLTSGAIGPGRMQDVGPVIGGGAAIAFGALALALAAAFYGSHAVDIMIARDERTSDMADADDDAAVDDDSEDSEASADREREVDVKPEP